MKTIRYSGHNKTSTYTTRIPLVLPVEVVQESFPDPNDFGVHVSLPDFGWVGHGDSLEEALSHLMCLSGEVQDEDSVYTSMLAGIVTQYPELATPTASSEPHWSDWLLTLMDAA